MNKSTFEELKGSIIESIKFSKTPLDLKARVDTILSEYGLGEED